MKILSETTLNSIMFLLIPLAYSCNYHCRNALNSIMFLLIPQKWRIYEQSNANFKFHYVSINSIRRLQSSTLIISLNSIMFLLIQKFFRHHISFYDFKFHYVSINSRSFPALSELVSLDTLNSIMFLLIPVPKPTAYLLHETPLFCRPLQNISFLSHSSSYVLATPPILAIFYFCRFPTFFTLSQVDRNHYIFIISSFLLA